MWSDAFFFFFLKDAVRRFLLVPVSMVAISLFLADSIITPGVSVLSAVEGLESLWPSVKKKRKQHSTTDFFWLTFVLDGTVFSFDCNCRVDRSLLLPEVWNWQAWWSVWSNHVVLFLVDWDSWFDDDRVTGQLWRFSRFEPFPFCLFHVEQPKWSMARVAERHSRSDWS